MFKRYRRPTVLVIGAGAAGCAAAAECGVSGFDVTVVDERADLGGRYAGADPARPPRRFRFRTPYLDLTRVDGTAASAREHLRAALAAGDVTVVTATRCHAASFDAASGRWLVDATGPDGGRSFAADVLIRATGAGTAPEITAPNGRTVDDSAHLHHGIEVVGAPNLLVVDAPEPADRTRRPLDLVEARADHCRRYVRLLETKGPGALTVTPTLWHAAPPNRRARIRQLGSFPPGTHGFEPAADPDSTPVASAAAEAPATAEPAATAPGADGRRIKEMS